MQNIISNHHCNRCIACRMLLDCAGQQKQRLPPPAPLQTPMPWPPPRVPIAPNTPAQTLAETDKLGNLAAAFITILTVAAVRRS